MTTKRRTSARSSGTRKRQAAQPKRRSGDGSAELKEALEQQAAVSRILRVMSQSPGDVQPVLDAVAKSAARLCRAKDVIIRRVDGGISRAVAHLGPLPVPEEFPIIRGAIGGAAILERRTVHIRNVLDPQVRREYPEAVFLQRSGSMLVAPLLREGKAIGTIVIRREEIQPFTDRQVALLETFADQAAIAIENVRLFNETTEALEQQTATADILKVISSSPTDIQPVLDAVAKSAARLCGTDDVSIRKIDGDSLRLVAHFGPIESVSAIPLNSGALMGRAVMNRQTVQVHDSIDEQALKDYPDASEFRRQLGIRTMLAVPLVRKGKAFGAILMRRKVVRPFTDKQIALLKTFADQAVIAIENVRLFRELEARNNDLSETLEQQTATSEILRIISSSPTDTQPVFDAIVKSGARLFECKAVSLRLVRGDHSDLVASTDAASQLRHSLSDEHSAATRAITRGQVVQVADMLTEDWVSEILKQRARDRGFRAVLAAPLMREGKAIGVINVLHAAAGAFSEKEVSLLKTFADQAVIAIENVRLFNETKEALEQQTATADILRVISSSPTDVQPVFDVVTQNAARLCNANDVVIRLVEGKMHRAVAHHGTIPPVGALPVVGSIVGRAMLDRKPVHIVDLLDPGVRAEFREADATTPGYRTFLAAPLIRENSTVGAIVMRRVDVSPFTDKQIALLQTFASQSVIAIENVRLFKELETRNAEITESLEQQTATSEILRVISSSPTDVMPVLETMTHRAAQLCDARDARLYLIEGDNLRNVVGFGELGDARETLRLTRGIVIGRAILDQKVVHIEDLAAALDEFPDARGPQRQYGHRTTLGVPLVREGKAFGAILIRRREVRPFTPKQIELVKTFADQAVIAIENVRLFNEIQDKSRQLEVASRHKSDFLAHMSHELRTPLNAIIGFSEALTARMFGEVNAKQDEYLHDIHSSGQHLLSLINDILDLAKVEAGRMELELSDFDLPTALRNAMTLVRERAQNHGIALELRVDKKLGNIHADERKVKQIVLNLLSNAVKFTPDGGRVEVDAHVNDALAEISVKDTGVGIAPEDQDALFEEFRQVGRDYTTKREGTGLGLALTRRFVELHGGKIWVESAPGKGSTFTFTMPLTFVTGGR